jgi:hypothetical protein
MKELILPKVAERDSRAPGILVFSSKRSSDEMNPNSIKQKITKKAALGISREDVGGVIKRGGRSNEKKRQEQ